LCKKLLLLALLLSFLPLASFSQDTSQDALSLIDLQAKLGQSIVLKLVESLNLRETQISQGQQSLTDDKVAFNSEKVAWQQKQQEEMQSIAQDQLALQNEKDTFQKQQQGQKQIEDTLNSLNKSLAKSEYWHKVKNKVIITLAVACIVEGIIIAVK